MVRIEELEAVRSEDSSVGREPPFREDLSPKAEEQLLIEAVTRKRLLDTVRD
jgi:hypothetical protein